MARKETPRKPPLTHDAAALASRTFHELAFRPEQRHALPLPLFESLLIDRNAATPYWPMLWNREIAMTTDYDETNLEVSRRFRQAMTLAMHQGAAAYPRQFMSMANVTVRLASPGRAEMHRRMKEHGENAMVVDVIREPIAAPRYRFATSVIGCASIGDCVAKLRNDEGAVLVPGESFRPAPGTIERASETANSARLIVNASGNALLVTSITHHKYWTATIDGVEVPIGPANLAFQGVLVPRGRHEVVFRYRNPLVLTGAAISAATALLLLLFVAYDLRREKANH